VIRWQLQPSGFSPFVFFVSFVDKRSALRFHRVLLMKIVLAYSGGEYCGNHLRSCSVQHSPARRRILGLRQPAAALRRPQPVACGAERSDLNFGNYGNRLQSECSGAQPYRRSWREALRRFPGAKRGGSFGNGRHLSVNFGNYGNRFQSKCSEANPRRPPWASVPSLPRRVARAGFREELRAVWRGFRELWESPTKNRSGAGGVALRRAPASREFRD
jgi:hypothetical protein